MRYSLSGELLFYCLIASLLLSSCSSYYWTDLDSADLETGDLVYKVRTVSGDTINFRSHTRSSGVFNGEEICGIDVNGDELILGLNEVTEIELAAWEPGRKYFVYGCIAVCMVYVLFVMNRTLMTP